MEFESPIRTRFGSGFESLFESVGSNRISRVTVSKITGILTDSLKRIRARIGKPDFARSGLPLEAPAQGVSNRREGGSK